MTTSDEKEQDMNENNVESDESAPSVGTSTAQKNGDSGPIIVYFIVGVVISLIIGWVVFPELLYSKKEQPIDFNHAMHLEEVEDDCASCHYFRADGTFSGIPTLENCLECHEEALGESEEEIRFVEEYVLKDREVPWLVYAKQPATVFFSHAAHVEMGEMDCVTCHGDIGESEHSRVYEENRLTGYSRDIWGKNIAGLKRNTWDRMKMDDCAECHRENDVNQASVQTGKGGCFVCHK
jgi:menaquinone reductase, multiheme cytochrome c subunit